MIDGKMYKIYFYVKSILRKNKKEIGGNITEKIKNSYRKFWNCWRKTFCKNSYKKD